MRFQRLTLDEIDRARPFFRKLTSQTCDFTVGGMFMWRDYYRMEYAFEDDTFFSRIYDRQGGVFYNLPISDSIPDAVGVLVGREKKNGEPIRFCTIPECYLPAFRQPGMKTSLEEQTEYFDYLYRSDDLINLSGKKFSGQRNQIHHFLRSADSWSFDPVSDNNISQIIGFFTESFPEQPSDAETKTEENQKVLEVLENFSRYGMFGGALYANGRVAGFSLGETVNGTLFTHIEKADRNFPGAYQMLVNQFASRFARAGADYINREEDMGDPGLAAAKSAYHPVALLKKYIVGVE